MVRIRQRWSLVLLGLVLGVGFVACKKDSTGGSGEKASELSAGGPGGGGDLALLPADSEVVFGVNLGQVQQSPLWKQFAEPKLAAFRGQMREDFKARCGVDPMKMVSSFTVGIRGFGDKPSAVAVLHGLDKGKVLDCFDKNKAELAKDGGEITRDGDTLLFKGDRGEAALQFTNDSTAVVVSGPSASAAAVKAVLSGSSSLKNSAPFLEMYKKVKTGDSIWALASGKVLERVPLGLKLTAAYGSINVTDSLALDTRVRFDKPEDATQAAEMASTQVKQLTPQYVDKAEATADGNELHTSVTVSGQKLPALIPILTAAAAMSGMGGN
jgi:hypothetical protein